MVVTGLTVTLVAANQLAMFPMPPEAMMSPDFVLPIGKTKIYRETRLTHMSDTVSWRHFVFVSPSLPP